MRKPNIYRTLELSIALNSHLAERQIVRIFSNKWRLRPHSVRAALHKLLIAWLDGPVQVPSTSVQLWKTSDLARSRMKALRAALNTCQARGDIVRAFSRQWDLTESWVDDLVVRVISEDENAIAEQIEIQRQRYEARLRSHLAKFSLLEEWIPSGATFERLALVSKAS